MNLVLKQQRIRSVINKYYISQQDIRYPVPVGGGRSWGKIIILYCVVLVIVGNGNQQTHSLSFYDKKYVKYPNMGGLCYFLLYFSYLCNTLNGVNSCRTVLVKKKLALWRFLSYRLYFHSLPCRKNQNICLYFRLFILITKEKFSPKFHQRPNYFVLTNPCYLKTHIYLLSYPSLLTPFRPNYCYGL